MFIKLSLSFVLLTMVFGAFAQNQKIEKARRLDRGSLVRVEDAEPTPVHQTDVEQLSRYEKTGELEDLFVVELNVNHGITENLQFRSTLPFIYGNGNRTGSSDLSFGALYSLLEGLSGKFPGIAVAGSARFPTGEKSSGIDGALNLNITMGVGEKSHDHRFHFNLGWKPNSRPREGEAKSGTELVFGYDTAINKNTGFILSAIKEREVYEDKVVYVIESAIRYDIKETLTTGAAIGTGHTDDSPEFRATITVSKTF